MLYHLTIFGELPSRLLPVTYFGWMGVDLLFVLSEEHFCLVLPLLVALLMRRPSPRKTVAVLASVVLFGIVFHAFLITHYPDKVWTGIYYPSYTRLDGLLTGVALAIIRTFRPAWGARACISQRHQLAIEPLGGVPAWRTAAAAPHAFGVDEILHTLSGAAQYHGEMNFPETPFTAACNITEDTVDACNRSTEE